MGDVPDSQGGPVHISRIGESVRLRWLGAAGAAALGLASCRAGALPALRPVMHWFQPQPALTLLAAALGYAGLVVLVCSWWRLGRLASSGAAGGPRQMLVTLCLWAAPLALGAPLFSRDVYSYVAQGAMAARGMDVYQAGPALLGGPLSAAVPAMWQHTPAPYGPVFVWLADHVVRLTGEHVVAAALGMRAVALLGLALIVWAVRNLARDLGVMEAGALWLAALNPLVLVHFVSGSHNDALMVGLVLSGLVVARRGRPAWGAVVITLAMLVKAPAGLALLFLIPAPAAGLRAVARRAVTVVVSSAVTVLAATLVLGYGLGWLSTLSTPVSGAGVLSLVSDVGRVLGAFTGGLGLVGGGTVMSLTRTAGMVLALAAIGYWWTRTRAVGVERGLGLALLSLVVFAPAVQPWYFLWGALLLAVTAQGRTRTWLAAVSVGLLFAAFLDGQVADVSYAACGYAGAALALATLYRLERTPGRGWRFRLTPRTPAVRGALPAGARGTVRVPRPRPSVLGDDAATARAEGG
ncbi:polyprenol phosphomannose-dependent alpha 1,6 mannosyltransferase MptB [Streptomyces sp. NPDC059740]|uniref:polyprenol phosphomannose-dependent alpha 1,6 mannosyltransferase MptB n=1 Tax=Streptomyces sp. NPDC059740 TaxID=3346926 RepID=UPI0036598576